MPTACEMKADFTFFLILVHCDSGQNLGIILFLSFLRLLVFLCVCVNVLCDATFFCKEKTFMNFPPVYIIYLGEFNFCCT